MINNIEKIYFDDLLNRGGYVLDFSTINFNDFTEESVGVRLCDRYRLSKGKSLNIFMKEGKTSKVIKLLDDLISYYEVRFAQEIELEKISYSGATYKSLYIKCKEILEREKKNKNLFIDLAEELKEHFSTEYMNNQIDLMILMCNKNPTEAIGKSKELLESCCKTIISKLDETLEVNQKASQLVKNTFKLLEIPDGNVQMDSNEMRLVKQITGSLSGLANGIFELRNHYGSGHGRDINFKSLTKRHAQLALGASITLTRYLWETYLYRQGL